MSHTAINRLHCNISNTPGLSGPITVGAARSGRRRFLPQHNGLAFSVTLEDGTNWEIRDNCVYTHAGSSLSRGVLQDSSSGAAINLTSATTVSVTLSAAFTNKIAVLEASGNSFALALPDGTQGAIASIAASQFGILTTNADNAPGFTALAAWIMGSWDDFERANRSTVIQFEAGVYYVDGAIMDLTWRGVGATHTPTFTLRGRGNRITQIVSTPTSTAPVVLQFLCGFIANCAFESMQVVARSDFRQDAVGYYATRRALDHTGGVTLSRWTDFGATTELGDACVFIGGSDDYWAPNQFLNFVNCSFMSNRGTSFKSYGQLGQVQTPNTDFSSLDKTKSACPAVILTADLRRVMAPTAADLANNFVTSNLEVTNGTPVRLIGTNLPSNLNTTTTYYVRRYLPATGNGDRLTFHTSLANVTNDVRAALGTTGTLGNWSISPLYPISSGTGVINFEFPHNLSDEAHIRLDGSGFPTPLAALTTYFVIRRSATQISLATSVDNVRSNTAIAFTGGTVTLFGISKVFAGVAAYSIDMPVTTVQNSITGLYLGFASDVRAHLHVEETKVAVYAYQSSVSINGGAFGNGADDSGNGCLLVGVGFNSRLSVDGAPYVVGTANKKVHCSNASYVSKNGWADLGAPRTTIESSGTLFQITAASTVNIVAFDFVFINSSATQINSFSSNHAPRARVRIMAFGGPIVIGNSSGGSGGNIRLSGVGANTTLADGEIAEFELVDTVFAGWVLIGRSA